MRKRLLDQDQDARQSRSDKEYLDAVKETLNGGVDPEDDDCLTAFVGLGLGFSILIETFLNHVSNIL